jgi:small subunit ribosomal protein S21
MARVIVDDRHSLDWHISLFHKKSEDEHIVKDFRERQYYVKPSAVKHRKNKSLERKLYVRELKNQKKEELFRHKTKKRDFDRSGKSEE